MGCTAVTFDHSGLYLAVGGPEVKIFGVKQDFDELATLGGFPKKVGSGGRRRGEAVWKRLPAAPCAAAGLAAPGPLQAAAVCVSADGLVFARGTVPARCRGLEGGAPCIGGRVSAEGA